MTIERIDVMNPIRPIQRTDIAECVQVIRNSFTTIAIQLGITEENAPRYTAFAINKKRLTDQFEIEKRPMFGYFQDEKIVGYYSLFVKNNHECELNHLCVLKENRHGGIGHHLLVHAVNTAKELGCKKINIGIVEENTVLRKWYEKHGFIHIGTKKYDFFPFTCGYLERNLTDEHEIF